MKRQTCVRAALVIAAVHLAAVSAVSQTLAPTSHASTTDLPFTASTGTVLHVRNMLVFRGPTDTSVTFYTQTPTRSSHHAQAVQEAKELVGAFSLRPSHGPFGRAIVAVCRTRACLDMREQSEEMFVFRHLPDGSWRYQPQ